MRTLGVLAVQQSTGDAGFIVVQSGPFTHQMYIHTLSSWGSSTLNTVRLLSDCELQSKRENMKLKIRSINCGEF